MLQFLEKIAWGFWDFIRRLTSLLMPFAYQSRYWRGVGRWVRLILAAVVLIGILVVLAWVNHSSTGLQALLKKAPRWTYLDLAKYWLPILALLMYVLVWLGWWLWKLLGPEEEISYFPDIDEAWLEAVRALNGAGIDVREPPLFLVFGNPAAGEPPLFEEAQLQLLVAHVPNRTAPLHVYANREGIYVTCAGASLLGRQSAILGDPALAAGSASDGALVAMAGGGADLFKTLIPKGRVQEVQGILAKVRAQGRTPSQLTEEETDQIRMLMAQDEAEQGVKEVKPRPQLLKDQEQAALLTARLKYLCRLIVRDRQPYCPVNGVMLLLPYGALDTREDADHTGAICHEDLKAARQVFQINCPLYALVCDMERAAGFREFIQRIPAGERLRRLGQRFPMLPELSPGQNLVDFLESSTQWIPNVLFPTWVYKLLEIEKNGEAEARKSAVGGNIQLYRLLTQLRDRRKLLTSVVVRSLANGDGDAWLFGGCYVAATGKDAGREQAFAAGVFRLLLSNQNFVSWTTEGTQDEERYQRWTQFGQIGIGLGLVLLVGLLYYAIKHSGS